MSKRKRLTPEQEFKTAIATDSANLYVEEPVKGFAIPVIAAEAVPDVNVQTAEIARVVSDLDAHAAEQLRDSFNALFDKASGWINRAKEIRVTSSDQVREMKLARESRLALKDIRVEAEKTRKGLKEDSLRWGRAIDGMNNVLIALIKPTETYLLEQETFADREEEKKRDELRRHRFQVLDGYGADASVYADLGMLSEDQWVLVAEAARQARDARAAAERAAQLTREQEEKKLAEDREVLSKRLAEQDAANAKLQREKRAAEAASKKVQLELAAERKKRAELEAAQEAERARLAAEQVAADQKRAAEEEALLMAPDREKLRAFEAALRAVTVPVLTSRHGRMAQKKLQSGMTEMIAWVAKVSEEL